MKNCFDRQQGTNWALTSHYRKCYTVTCKITERKRRSTGISRERRIFSGISDPKRNRKKKIQGDVAIRGEIVFYIIIGQSGSGKTSFVRDKFIFGEMEVAKGDIYYTKSNGMYALGKYGVGIRTEGTDTLPYNAKTTIKKQLRKFAKANADVVLEGDRINNAAMFDFVSTLGVDVKLYLVTCSVRTSMERLRAAGSTITPAFVKATKTKSRRMFLKYSGRFNGEVIKTD